MAQVSFVASNATTYDLTSVSVNPDAANEASGRQGGFVSRNRITWASVTAPTLTNKVMNVLKLLKIPDRTVTTGYYLIAPKGTAGVTHNCNSKAISSGVAAIGFIAYKSASHTSTSTDADGIAQATLIKSKIHTGSVLALPGDPETSPKAGVRWIGTGIAGMNHGWADGTGDQQSGMYWPYGGYLTFQIESGKGPSGTAASSLDGVFSGVLEVAATGFTVPE